LQLLLLFAVCVGLGVVLAPYSSAGGGRAPAILGTGVGVALIFSYLGKRRMRQAVAASGGRINDYPFQLPASAQSLARSMQGRFSRGCGPGVLCATTGYAEFFPTKEKHAHLAWSDHVGAVQVKSFFGGGCVLRVHGLNGSHQLAAQIPAKEVKEALSAGLRVVDGWTLEDPTS
jgi:hypothetical protein